MTIPHPTNHLKLGLHQSARLEQRLVQSPQMIQAMQILQLPALDLSERIDQELGENPFLEVAEPDQDGDDGQAATDQTKASEVPEPDQVVEQDGLDNMLEVLERYERDFGDGRERPSISSEDGDRKYEAMQNAPDEPKTLAEVIMDQITFLSLSERERAVVEYVVWSLDDHGYLQGTPEHVAEELSTELTPPVEPVEIEDALWALRNVTHPGLGAADLQECLLLQLGGEDEGTQLARRLVEDHLPDIEANRLPRIAKATGQSLEDIKEGIALIKTLDPYPGTEFGEARATVIHPDVIVEEIDGDYVVRLDRQHTRELKLNPVYREMLQKAERGDGVREFVKKRLETARWFIDAVQQRQSTLQRIADRVFLHQRDFLARGVSGLHPLRMQEVAEEIGVHISTVSRGVSGKYAQTPRGIFPLKYFFTGGTTKDTGEVAAQATIKERIRELVGKEDPKKPLSDDLIAAKLGELDGIHIARRTVTKYRKALSIPSSTQRRQY